MAVISNLAALTILAAEQATVAAAVVNGSAYSDATGMLNSVYAELQEIKIQLTNLNATMPAGSNKTAIATVITNLA